MITYGYWYVLFEVIKNIQHNLMTHDGKCKVLLLNEVEDLCDSMLFVNLNSLHIVILHPNAIQLDAYL